VPANAESPAHSTDAVERAAPSEWIYLDAARLQPPKGVLPFSRLTLVEPSTGAYRPLAGGLTPGSFVEESGAEATVSGSISVWMSGSRPGLIADDAARSGMMAGAKWALVLGDAASVAASAGMMRELGGSYGTWMRFSIGRDAGPLRLGATMHGEHVFSAARDDLDLMIIVGASYAVSGPLRLGLESLAQDIEEVSSNGAENGARWMAGPTLGLELQQRSLWIGVGPALGLTHGAPQSISRFALAYGF
jgi:hypothetical protein